MNDFTEEELERQHKENGYCGSCGWHASFYETDYELTGGIVCEQKEWWDSCKNYDDEDHLDHGGCYIYTGISYD